MMAKCFAGSTQVPGESMLSWCFDPEGNVDGDPCNPLKEEPSAERLNVMRFIIKFLWYQHLRHGCCFALMKNDKPVAAAFLVPPNNKEAYKETACFQMWAISKLGLPKEMSSGDSMVRFDAMAKAMGVSHRKLFGKEDLHWYIPIVAVGSEYQGKGYGRELFSFIGSLGDHTKNPMYLETFGPRNQRFYERNGFEVMDKQQVVTKKETLKLHDGSLGMVRPASN
ncbi:hypothetical protein TL16_g11964 [Triparma laevis f. inornata]|uniref:N-acetyltransferase domain-containing protein n=1 Tax=Triparma laevis f. inornata TaxID=1714386 RepID=A0A9W7BRP0_9STRA|nr:hypothetical protein TL16_g11964 [Triparma laevis f. inornata]